MLQEWISGVVGLLPRLHPHNGMSFCVSKGDVKKSIPTIPMQSYIPRKTKSVSSVWQRMQNAVSKRHLNVSLTIGFEFWSCVESINIFAIC